MRTATSTRTIVLLLIGVLIAAVGLILGAGAATSKPTVPAPVITSGPATNSASTSAAFTMTTANATTMQCSLDAAAFAPCTSPKTYSSLSQGSHTFNVKAIQGSDQSATTSYTWTVDTIAPPAPIITSKPANFSATSSPTFTFADGEPGVAFRCSLDGGAYASCTTPKSYSSLSQGSHTFGVQAVDAAGNTSAAATYAWVVDTVASAAPAITTKPTDPTYNATNTFAWTGSEGGLTFQCSTENGAWFTCQSPYTWVIETGNYGQHQFGVRALDAAGNASAGTYYSFKYQKGLPTSGMPFQISGSVTGLTLGTWKPITVTLTNPNPAAIYVDSLAVGVNTSQDPPGCASATNLELQQSNISTAQSVIVPAGGSVMLPAQGGTTPQIRLKDLSTNQDACKGGSFALTYSGTAHN